MKETDEELRIASLCRLGVLDTPEEERFDRFTAIAATAFATPIALVSLVDTDRQWFKSHHGVDARETPRSMAFCSHAIEADATFVVNDAALDPRFADNALVTGAPHIRFYAGQPIFSDDGHAVGTLCIIDTAPRTFDAPARQMLKSLAAMVEAELNKDALVAARASAERSLKELNAELEQRIAERTRALEQKQELLDAVLETVDVGVVACDAGGNLSFFNHAALEFHGQAPARMDAGELAAHYDLFHADGSTPLAPHEIPLLRALAGETVNDVVMVIAPRGMRRRTVLASGRRLVTRAGERLGAVVAMKDITELNESRAKLHANEHRLRAITENLPTMIGQVDRDGCLAFLNARAVRFYGKPAEELIGRPVREAYSYAEYATVAPHIAQAMAGTKAVFEGQTTVDGKVFYYHASYMPNYDANGAPDGFFAMAYDITTRRKNEILRAESEDRLRTITNNVPVLISYLDRDLNYGFANAMYKEWMGVRSEDMVGRSMTEVFGDDYYRERESSLKLALDGHMSNIEVKVSRKGRSRVLSTTYIPHLRDGAIIGIYVLSTDATAAREHERHLLLLANADPLTALPNRRMYEVHLNAALARAKRHDTGLALMYLDIDNFKHINDTLGHGAGDEVLIAFGQRLKAVLRDTDLLARLAGDEFTVVVESVESREACELVAAKMLAALQAPFLIQGRPLAVTASIGVALAEQGITAAVLANQADTALYAAKRAGRNRYSIASDGPERRG